MFDLILAEKSTGNAEKAIRYTTINTYNDLFEGLRQDLKQTGSVLSIKIRIESCKQGPTESVQTFSLRFKQILNELNYELKIRRKTSHQQIYAESEARNWNPSEANETDFTF